MTCQEIHQFTISKLLFTASHHFPLLFTTSHSFPVLFHTLLFTTCEVELQKSKNEANFTTFHYCFNLLCTIVHLILIGLREWKFLVLLL